MAFLDFFSATPMGAKFSDEPKPKYLRYEFVKFSKTHTDQVIATPSNGKMTWEER